MYTFCLLCHLGQKYMNENLKTLRKIATETGPIAFSTCSEFLKSLHTTSNQVLGRYSYRQLASDLGFAPTNIIHLFVQGHRPLSDKSAHLICESLQIKGENKKYFLTLAKLTQEKQAAKVAAALEQATEMKLECQLSSHLAKSQLDYYKEWYHAVVRELVGLPSFDPDPKWIASKIRPNITAKQASDPFHITNRSGSVQTQIMPQGRNRIIRRIHPQNRQSRITRQDFEHNEYEDRCTP